MAQKFVGEAGLNVLVEEIKKKSSTDSLFQYYAECIFNDDEFVKWIGYTSIASLCHVLEHAGMVVPQPDNPVGPADYSNIIPVGDSWPTGKTLGDIFSDNRNFLGLLAICGFISPETTKEITAQEVTDKFNS